MIVKGVKRNASVQSGQCPGNSIFVYNKKKKEKEKSKLHSKEKYVNKYVHPLRNVCTGTRKTFFFFWLYYFFLCETVLL